MSRLIPQADMTAAQLVRCSYDALAIITLCEHAAWAIQQDTVDVDVIADAISSGLKLATELLAPVHDALELHEAAKGGEA